MKFFLISLGIRPRIGLILRVLFGVSTLSVLLCYADIVHAEKKPHPSEMQDVKQQKEITGKVTDVEGEPLVGVNVSVRGTTIGTITDIEGFFSLQVTKGAVLVISYIGYLKEILEVGDPATYSITLQEDTHKLDEVVVVGYQSKERKNLTGSVATVDTKMLENRPAARGTDLLQGVAPGLIISRTNPGRVGGGGVGIEIQGVSARSGSDVLIVIDGVPQPLGSIDAINSINPNDIENISVLKDGEAVVYGSRASSGVIVITTKSGKQNRVEASYTASFKTPSIYTKKANVIDTYLLMDKAWNMSGIDNILGYPTVINYIKDNNLTFNDIKNNDYKHIVSGSAPFPDTPFLIFSHYDWFDMMYGTAITHNYDVTASGSTEKASYYTSVGYIDEGSMLRYGDNSNKTMFARVKLDYKFNNWITVGSNINLRYNNLVEPIDLGGLEGAIANRASWDIPYTPEGRYCSWGGPPNPIGLAQERGENKQQRYMMSAQFYVDITPVKNLKIRAVGQKSYDGIKARATMKWFDTYYWNESFAYPSLPNRNADTYSYYGNNFDQSLNMTVSADYKNTFLKDHAIRAFAAFTHEEFQYDRATAQARDLAYLGLSTLNLGNPVKNLVSDTQMENTLKGLLANVGYTYKDKYTVEGYFRRDGSSRFAPGHRWNNFYGVGAAYIITNESYFKKLKIDDYLNYLKIRVNYGELGNQAGIGNYDFVQGLIISQSNILFGSPSSVLKQQIATMSGFPSDTRTWQISRKLNVGVDVNLFDDRLNIIYNQYVTNTNNAFYTEEFPSLLGTTAPSINGAKIRAKGWDLGVTWRDEFKNGISYSVSVGLNDSKTKAIRLPDNVVPDLSGNAWVEGYPLGAQFGLVYDGIMQNQEEVDAYYSQIKGGITNRLQPGDARYRDLDGDGIIESTLYQTDENGKPLASSGDMVYLGDTRPHYQYYINLSAGYKGFEISAILNGVGKWHVVQNDRVGWGYPWTQVLEHAVSKPGWTPENPGAEYPRLFITDATFDNSVNGHNYTPSTAPYSFVNVPWLNVKNIQLAYTLPKEWVSMLHLNRIKIYANATDLGYIVNKMPKSYSPEQPFASAIAPYTRSFSIGLNVGF
ncbi:SusC/RagA family TonB-linked outer membrane protein [uncultured Parabacteroides sp.]|jgi:TonB-linked SusC/RagA family outer membrane protein|uniref:SusC/RagA family TonB-linked outer membrane protein n=1 Tax=uncultured Parabacteroides sp. TaxID=512312 RepID=UPI0025DBF640|nr:SusC/RagA family TonB-linked outer membrane protein [uncultured Parabacteroides sp.]